MKTTAPRLLEICIDSVASAQAAAEGGADRVELCANLPEGGTTPSAGMIRGVRAAFSRALMVMIRPRGYDFLYSEEELQVMLHDIEAARELGADGVVFGCLNAAGRVDMEACSRLVAAAGGLDITFHRAFDMTRDLVEALDDVIQVGIKRILTSGGHADVPSGEAAIAKLVQHPGTRVSIMPGGGVTEQNIAGIIQRTGAREIHLSARDAVHSAMEFRNPNCAMGAFSKANEYEWRAASVGKIRTARKRLDEG